MNRRTLLLLSFLAVAVLSVVATPRLLYYHRKNQLNAARDLVADHGGSFGLDLVDGNYMLDLHGEASTDETLQAILPTLKALPNGFTLIGPGESRLFYVSLRDSRITDAGMRSLCALPIVFLSIDCPNLTDASADILASLDQPYVTITGSVPFSDNAIRRLQNAKPNTLLELSADRSR